MIVCCKKAMAGYKRRAAKAYPKEYLEILFGSVQGKQISIERSVYVPQCGTKLWVGWKCDEEYQDIIASVEAEHGLEFIGTIHSHTTNDEWSHLPSPTDHMNAEEWEEKIFLIDWITRRNAKLSHKLLFYRPQELVHEVAYF